MAPIVQVDHVYKKYSRNANAHLSYGLGDLYNHLLGRTPSLELRKDEFFAVNDVSFSLQQGDSLALIGRNGSGKSTLLKMMNGLVKLDAGQIVMDGRVQALINLSAGFKGALSGLDNIYNSAALYGFNRKQTRAIADEIIDFSELDEFINSPVETYSSGMTARLGFAVAVHLRPRILLIDEILAVGDAAFQNKCFQKMEVLRAEGVTLVLVSHSHAKVIQVCERALWLHQGRAKVLGPVRETVQAYLDFLTQEEQKLLTKAQQAPKKTEKAQNAPVEPVELTCPLSKEAYDAAQAGLFGPIYDEKDQIEDVGVRLFSDGHETDVISFHSTLKIRISFTLKTNVRHLHTTVNLYRRDGTLVSALATMKNQLLEHIHTGKVCCELVVPDFDYTPGVYVIMLPICDGKSYLFRNVVKEFMVDGGGGLFWGITEPKHEISCLEPDSGEEPA